MKQINTALLSFGMSGRVFHAPFINLHKGFHLTGSWERSKKQIQEFYPGTHSYDSFEAVLNDDSIDLVVVNTPVYSHFEYAAKALKAGKHVVVEKAFTSTVSEAEELKAIALGQNRQIAVFQNRRWDSDFSTVKQVIDSGVLGEINEMEIHFDRFNLQLSPKKHKEEPNSGAGITRDLGPHIIDQALYLFGMPDAVFADLRTTRPDSIVEDCLDILLYYPSFRVRIKGGFIVKEVLPAYIVHGAKGSFLKSRADVQEADLQKELLPDAPNWGTEPKSEEGLINYDVDGENIRKKIETLQGNYLEFYNGVYNSLTQNKSMPVTVDDGIRVMKIIEAAFQSSEARKAITVID